MATQPNSPKQTDEYPRVTKRLQSAIQRVRSRAGVGAEREAALVAALNDLVAHLIQGHLWGAATPGAQEALRLSSATLFAEGAVSNYTDPDAANRCGTALVHLGVVQFGLGLDAAATATINSWQGLAAQLGEYQIDSTLSPSAAAWAQYCRARAALVDGDTPAANAGVDALRLLLDHAEPALLHQGNLLLDAQRLSADARWQAGRTHEAMGFLHAAKRGYDARAQAALTAPAQHPKTLVERLAEPLFGLYRDYADRLALTGDADLALLTRRTLAELLSGLATAIPTPSTGQLAATGADLSLDLVRVDRIPEAREAAAEAVRVAGGRGVSPTIRLLVRVAVAEVLLADGQPSQAKLEVEAALDAEQAASEPANRLAALVLEQASNPSPRAIPPEIRDAARGTPGLHLGPLTQQQDPKAISGEGQELAAERQQAREMEAEYREQAQREVERRKRDQAESERAAAAAETTAKREAQERTRIEAQRVSAAAEAERQELKRRRAERLRRHALEATERAQSERAERRGEIAELILAAEREGQGEAEVAKLRLELADLERAELDAAAELDEALTAEASETVSTASADAVAVEAQRVEPEPVEPELVKPELVEPEPAAAQPAETQPVSAPVPPSAQPIEVEPVPLTDELSQAESALADARTTGNRKATRQAAERLAEQLRPRAQADPAGFGPRFRAVLEELSGLRLRGGDLFGSRAASKEAKTYQQV